MKKIYFACSIRGGRDDADTYAELVDYLKTRSKLLTEIFADQKLTSAGMNKPSAEIWKIDTNWIRDCDALIAEVTNPSLGVGYEIAKAEEWGKPVLALFRNDGDRKLSAMIEGSPQTHVVNYSQLGEANDAVAAFLSTLE
jgi:nucleoside 2-deoxyribosyltransferase